MSADGRRVAFATWIDGKNHLVVNGEEGEGFDSVTFPPALSENGMVVAAAARIESVQFCIVNGKKLGPYQTVGVPVTSADGSAVAFPASDGSGWFVSVGGERGPTFPRIGEIALSRDGRRVAYAAEVGRPDGSAGVTLVLDGRTGSKAYDRISLPTFSEDGRAVGYAAFDDGRWLLVTGDRETPVDGPIESVFLSAQGDLAGAALEEGRVVAPGYLGAQFDWIGWPRFSPGGQPIYLAARGKKKLLVAGKKEIDLGECVVWDLVLSPDGSRAAYGAYVGMELLWKVVEVDP